MYNSQFSQHNWAVSASLLFPFRRVHQGVVGVSYGTGTHWAYITLHDDTPVANFSARRSFAGEKRIIEFWMFGKSLKLFVCRYYIMNSFPFARLFSTIAFVLGVFHTRVSHLARVRNVTEAATATELQNSIPSILNIGKSICSQRAGPEIKREQFAYYVGRKQGERAQMVERERGKVGRDRGSAREWDIEDERGRFREDESGPWKGRERRTQRGRCGE